MRGFSPSPTPWRFGARSSFVVLISAVALVAISAMPAAAAARRHTRRAAGGGCPDARTPADQASTSEMRTAVVCLINRARGAHGLPPLHVSPRLNRSAQNWTNAMVGANFFSHGSNFAARISAVGFNWASAGENIATGYATPRGVVSGWMASTGHCQNILNPAFRDLGTGVRWTGLRGYGTGPGTWTEDFALPMGQRRMSGNYGPMHHCPY